MTTSIRFGSVVALFIGLMCAPSMVAGQTFKGGQVAWQASDALTVEFSIQGAWRRDAYSTANGRCISLVTLAGVPCSGADGFPEPGDVIVEAEANTTFDPGDGGGAIGSPVGPLLFLITSVNYADNLVNGIALNPV